MLLVDKKKIEMLLVDSGVELFCIATGPALALLYQRYKSRWS